MRWIVSQEGSRQSYGVPLSFQRAGCLRLLYTDAWCRYGRQWLLRGPAGARALAGRYHAEIAEKSVVSFNVGAVPWLARQHFRRGRISADTLADYYIRFGQWFANKVLAHVERLELDPERDGFFGFNTNCLETIQFLKSRGIFCVVDQVDPGRAEEDLIVEEAARWPGWEQIPGRMPEAYWERLSAEWAAADAVLVNSEWSRDALEQQGVPTERIIVVPCAMDLQNRATAQPVMARGTLQVVWLGSVILRKGIQYLAEAARLLQGEDIEFTVAGPVGISKQALDTFPPNIKMIGRVTRDQSDKIYRSGHVFVLPTLSDGFAITQLEAMAHGLPVVTTPNCARVVTDGVDGLVVPACDASALAAALLKLHRNREFLAQMSGNALEKVRNYAVPQDAFVINREVARLRNHSTSNASMLAAHAL